MNEDEVEDPHFSAPKDPIMLRQMNESHLQSTSKCECASCGETNAKLWRKGLGKSVLCNNCY
eukprot:Awhi_evm1s9328